MGAAPPRKAIIICTRGVCFIFYVPHETSATLTTSSSLSVLFDQKKNKRQQRGRTSKYKAAVRSSPHTYKNIAPQQSLWVLLVLLFGVGRSVSSSGVKLRHDKHSRHYIDALLFITVRRCHWGARNTIFLLLCVSILL